MLSPESAAAASGVPYKVFDTGFSRIAYLDTFTVAGGRLFFRANGGNGRNLWVSDGTGPGTYEISVGSVLEYAQPSEWMQALSDVVILGLEYVPEPGIWRSDGTVAGTYRLTERFSRRGVPTPEDRLFFFSSPPGTIQEAALELWRTDGTHQGTLLLATILDRFAPMVPFGGLVFFPSRERPLLYRSDGTAPGTFAIAAPRILTTLRSGADVLWYWDGGLWTTDGTEGGARWVAETPFPVSSIFTEGARAYFQVATSIPQTYDLWASDGTETGTARVAPLDTLGPRGDLWPGAGGMFAPVFRPYGLTVLWHSRGSRGNTQPVAEIRPLAEGGVGREAIRRGDRLYFFELSYRKHGPHWLWTSDGTAAGTHRVAALPLAPSEEFGYPRPVQAAFRGSTLFFAGTDAAGAEGLWAVDLEDAPSCIVDCVTGGTSSGLRGAVDAALERPGCPALDGLYVRVDLLVGQVAARLRGCPLDRPGDTVTLPR